MPPPERGAVVLVPFRFTNEGPVKYRPAVVISVDGFQQARAEMIVAAVTSNTTRLPLLGDYFLQDWELAGLPKPSWTTAILRTLRHAMVVGRLGGVSARDLGAIEAAIATVLGLAAPRSAA